MSGITLYPIKALDGVAVVRAQVNPSGALHGDRQFAMVDNGNAFINGKRYPQVNQIKARYSRDLQRVFLSLAGLEGEDGFELSANEPALCEWLSDALAMRVVLERNELSGFPDSSGSPGPTLISRASLEAVNSWLPELSMQSLRRRFRANLEIDGVPAFWEDTLVLDGCKPFNIGELTFSASELCDRCQVPTQDPDSGEVDGSFQTRFMGERAAVLPAGTNPYTLSIKTRLAHGAGGALQLGMDVRSD